MQYQVLGPVRAYEGDDEVELGGPKQRLVLAMLLAAHGATVSTDALVEGLWTGREPATARKTLQGYIHHLRSRMSGGLETDKAGYSLRVTETSVDERVFSRTVNDARPLVTSDPTLAAEQLDEALAAWRGNPYADLDGAPVLRPEVTRLNEIRVVALGDRLEADLALGRHAALIGELESLTVDYPLDERFRGLHMLALYRSGRQAEALRACSRAREFFVEEVGLDPSAQLIELERRMLDRDPSLDVVADETQPTARAIRGYELRERIATDAAGDLYRGYQRSVGREVAIRATRAPTADDPQFIARYRSDVARIAQVDHPYVLDVQDAWREPGSAYQVMRWVDGERLDAFLARERLSDWDALTTLEHVGSALDAAHRSGVVHGDVRAHTIVRSVRGDAYLSGFVVGADPGLPADDVAAFGLLMLHVLLGVEVHCHSEVGNVLASAILRPGLQRVLERVTAADGASASELVAELRRELGGSGVELAAEAESGGVTQSVARSDARSPYKGLQAFQATDSGDFYGRDELIDRLHDRLARHRVVAVVGPSGSGKSSLVRAGLVPRLICGPRPIVIAEMYPGAHPFDALDRALRSVAVRDIASGEELLDDRRSLLRAIDAVLPDRDVELVLLIDQFEELFASVASEAVRARFLDALVTAVGDSDSRLRVVVTMRADFFDRPLRYAEFGALVDAGLVPVGMPDDAGLAEAIERPAAAVGVVMEPGLVNEIVRDVADEPGGLPLLQYALTELFDSRRSDVLRLEDYRASGGVVGAVAQRADSLFEDLDTQGRAAMQQALLRMVSIDERGGHIRRRVTRAELRTLEVDQPALDDGIRRFGAHRLLTFDSDPVSRAPTAEIAHESLIDAWARLRRWVDDERDQLVVRRRLDAARVEWEESGEDSAFLLRGRRLAQFDDWASRTGLALSSNERAFLQASREHDEARAQSESRRRRRAALALVAVAVVAIGVGIYALVLRSEAADEAFAAETARLGNAAGFVAERDRQTALLMAAETYLRDPGFEGLSALERVLVDAGPYLGNVGAGDAYDDAAWLDDDRLLGISGDEAHLFDVATGEVIVLPIDVEGSGGERGTSGLLGSTPAGLAAVAAAGGGVMIVDGVDATVESLPTAERSTAVAISNDGTRIAVGFDDGRIEVIDRASGTSTASVDAHVREPDDITLPVGVSLDPTAGPAVVSHLRFDADGERIVSVAGILVQAWNASDLSPAGPEVVHAWGDDDLNLVATAPAVVWFDPDDPDVLVTAGDAFVARWRVRDGSRLSLHSVGTELVDAAAGGDGIVLLGVDGTVVRGRYGGAERSAAPLDAGADFAFDTQERVVSSIAVDDAGTRVGIATDDGVVVAALDGTRLAARAVPIGSSDRPSLASDGHSLAAGRVDDGLYDITGEPPTRIPFDVDVEVAQHAGSAATYELVRAGSVDAVLWTSTFVEMRNAYELDTHDYLGDFWGSFVPAWSDDGRLRARRLRNGETRIEEPGVAADLYASERSMTSADFDGVGERVVVVFEDGDPAVLVDLRAGAERQLPATPGGIVSAVFTPDGRDIVMIGGAGSVRMLDADTLELRRDFDGIDAVPRGAVAPPVLDAAGTLMYSAADGAARLWHVPSGRLIGKPLPTQPGGVPAGIADGRALRVVTPHDDRALIWNLATEEWVQLACRAAGRNMTDAEWAAFGPRSSDYRRTCSSVDMPESRGT